MYAIFAAILVILIVILFLPIKAEIFLKEKKPVVKIFIAEVPVFKKILSRDDKGTDKKAETPVEQSKKFEKDTRTLGEKIRHYASVFKTAAMLLKKYVSIDEVRLIIDVGTGDAAVTAVTAGALWAVTYGFLGILGKLMYISCHSVQINPVYADSAFSVDGKCIFKSRIVYIIFIAITILIKIQSRKGKEE